MASPEFTHWSSVKTVPLPGPSVATSSERSHGKNSVYSEKRHLWMFLDAGSVALATGIAILVHNVFDSSGPGAGLYMYHPPNVFYFYIAGFTLALLDISRVRGLYDSLLGMSGLREQRLTVESCLTAGLVLSGALYLAR